MAIRFFYLMIILTFAIISCSNVSSQTTETQVLTLKTLSNEIENVNIEFDNINDRIIFRLNSKKKLSICGYRGLVGDIKILGQKFISVNYYVRGGSGVKMQKTTILCISHGELYKALDILSNESYDFNETYDRATDSLELFNEHGLYSLKIIELEDMKETFRLSTVMYQTVMSKHDKKDNYKKIDTIKFFFDEKNNSFYMKYLSLIGDYTIEGSKNGQRTFYGEKYPSIKLRDDEYVNIDKVWYNKMRGNRLVKILNTCN